MLETIPENFRSSKTSVLEIFIHKVSILAKNGESGVQRSLYISRTVNATENLIRYSESTENFLSRMSHQIFAYLSSSGCNFTKKTANFHATFGWSLLNILTTTWKILMQLAQKWDKMDTNQMVWDTQAPISQNPSKLTLIYGWSNVIIFNSRALGGPHKF